MSNVMKIRPLGVELFHADREIYMTKLSPFLDFVIAPENVISKNVISIMAIYQLRRRVQQPPERHIKYDIPRTTENISTSPPSITAILYTHHFHTSK